MRAEEVEGYWPQIWYVLLMANGRFTRIGPEQDGSAHVIVICLSRTQHSLMLWSRSSCKERKRVHIPPCW